MTRAVVFGYHNVGVRCLRALIAAGVDVPLVLTHEDNPAETIWFDSVARTGCRGRRQLLPDSRVVRRRAASFRNSSREGLSVMRVRAGYRALSKEAIHTPPPSVPWPGAQISV